MITNEEKDFSFDELVLLDWREAWMDTARAKQIMPTGDWWTTWVVLAGRGFGKTRMGAEALGWHAATNKGVRCGIVAPTTNDVRAVCIEGESGLMSVLPPSIIESYNKSLLEVTLKNGSIIRGFSAEEPGRLRGPQHNFVWCCVPGTMIEMPCGLRKSIERVLIGDVVMTRHGKRKVLSAGVSGNTNSLVHIDCGVTSLTVTSDHPILVGDQWIPAGDIKQGDLLWATNTSAKGTRTESSTSNTKDQSQKAGLFITRMKTKATTALTILRQCRVVSISGFMQWAAQCQKLIGWRRLSAWLLCTSQNLQRAFIAAKGFFPAHLVRLENFALKDALKSGGTTVLCQSRATVWFAMSNILPSKFSKNIAVDYVTQGRPSEPIGIAPLEVLNVELLPNTVTYNLTVEGEHEYIANGIVVHNCDELAAWQYPDETWQMMKFGLRLGQSPRVIVTTTPKPIDLVRQLIEEAEDDESSTIMTTGTTFENAKNLATSFIDELTQFDGTQLGRQELYAELISELEGGIVSESWFKLWPADRPLPQFEYVVQSYDCATSDKTSNDPTACVVLGVFRPSEDKGMAAMVIDAWSEHMQYPDLRPKVIEEARSIYGDENEFGNGKKVDMILIEDKSAGISLIQDLQRANLPVRSYNPGRADKTMRLNLIAPLIMRGRVYLPESEERRGKPKRWLAPFVTQVCSFPNARHDDFCVDAMSLIAMADGSIKPIKYVEIGEQVMTPNGAKKVTAVHDNGIKEVWQVTVGHAALLATANHEIMTKFGWKRVDSLTQACDIVTLYQKVTSWHFQPLVLKLKVLSLTVKNTIAIPRARILRIVNILVEQVIGCIGMFGNTTMERCQTGTTSITMTATQATTTYQTLSASHAPSIGICTGKRNLTGEKNLNNWRISPLLDPKQLRGIDLKKAGHGIVSTLKTASQKFGASQKCLKKPSSLAFGVARLVCAKLVQKSFAALRVNQQSLDLGLVKQVHNTHTMRHVYDLTVEGEHCYYANGILVHNCDALSQGLRMLRDMGLIEIDPVVTYDDEYDEDIRPRRENPYAM